MSIRALGALAECSQIGTLDQLSLLDDHEVLSG
jgi:hypothetical protein